MCCSRRNLISLFLFLLCLSASPASPAELQSIRITGNSAVSTREVLDWLSVKTGAPFSESAFRNSLRAVTDNLQRMGYLGAQATIATVEFTADSGFVAVTVDVREGRRSLIGSITCSGQHQLTQEAILEQFEARPGDPLNAGQLEQDIDASSGQV
jgi:outer membrane protein assembly factor BamA